MKQAIENHTTKHVIISALFSAALLVGIIACFICDLAISHSLTWSPIPAISMIFAWAIIFPGISGKKKAVGSFISLSIFIIPYLYLLSRLVRINAVFSVGTAVAIISVLFLWLLFAIFHYIGKKQKLTALGVSFLSAVPFIFIINGILAKMISQPFIDVWDLLSVFVLLVSGAASFICGYKKKKEGR